MAERLQFQGTDAATFHRRREELRRRRRIVEGLFHSRGARALGAKSLALEGYVTAQDICAAPDRALLALPNLGPGVLGHIRTVFPASEWSPPAWLAEE